MLPLRPFLLNSDTLVYDGGGLAQNQRFPQQPKGNSRCAIVGLAHRVTGASAATIGAWGSLIQGLEVAGRRYVQGSIPLPLLAADAAQVAGAAQNVGGITSYFPGSHIPLAGGQLCAGIPLGPNDEVRITILRRNAGAFVTQVALVCVQFPEEGKDPSADAIYNALRNRGLGEFSMIGHVTDWLGAGQQVTFEGLPQPPNSRVVRRVGLRGVVTDSTGLATGFEVGAVAVRSMNNLLVRVQTSFNRPPQNALAPARAILGLPGYDPHSMGLVDMRLSERARVDVFFAGTAVAAATQFVHVLDMFEGRDDSAPMLEAADAVS